MCELYSYGARLCMFPFIFSVAVQSYIYIKNITRSIGAFLVADFCFLAYLNKARKQKFGVFEFRALRAARFHLWFPVKGLSCRVFFFIIIVYKVNSIMQYSKEKERKENDS